MERFVHKYLTKEYYIWSFITDDICSKETSLVKYNLVFELMDIFSIDEPQAVEFVESWAKKIKLDVDLCPYWVLHTERNLRGQHLGIGRITLNPGIYTREIDNVFIES